jgi:hypothetical protein
MTMATNQNRPNPPAPDRMPTKQDTTTPAEERGERIDRGRDIARGGKREGPVPGATGDDAKDPQAGR